MNCLLTSSMGRDSSVGIATRYGLDGPEIESRWGARLSGTVQTGSGTHPASYTTVSGSLLGVKRPGRDADHPHPSSAEVKERVEPYLYSLCAPSWPVLRWPLPLLSWPLVVLYSVMTSLGLQQIISHCPVMPYIRMEEIFPVAMRIGKLRIPKFRNSTQHVSTGKRRHNLIPKSTLPQHQYNCKCKNSILW